MRQIPFFAPCAEGHVAAVLTLPDEPPRGMVISLTGVGLYQVIGSKFCMQTASSLAAQGLASVRLDFAGVGDSTGLVTGWQLADVEAVVAQAHSALGASMRETGLTQFAVAGMCYGSRVALRLLDDPACVGAVCLAAPILEFGGWTSLRRTFRDRPIISSLRRNPAIRRLIVAPLRALLKERKPTERVVGALSHLDRARLLFLYSESFARDHYSGPATNRLLKSVSALPDEQRSRFDLRILPTGPLTAFDLLAEEDTTVIVNEVASWLRSCFERTHPDRESRAAEAA